MNASVKSFLKEWVLSVAIAFAVCAAVQTFVAQPNKIVSGSMIPTIPVGGRVIVEKLSKPEDLKPGDIVLFHPAPDVSEEDPFIKRLIGVGGDVIEVKDGELYRNGNKINEPYVAQKMNYKYGPVTVPSGSFFFLGDNRNESFDSHLWPNPFLGKENVIGRAVFQFYPFSSFGKLR